jgi:phosphoribosyl-AMP cyclohydrolase
VNTHSGLVVFAQPKNDGLHMELDFSKLDGLITAVIQDWKTGRVLMVGFMNPDSWKMTVDTGFATFWSRSRKKLWLKGESSGHKLAVKEIFTDCDTDALVLKCEELGPGVCHEGYQSCFFRKWDGAGWIVTEERAYDPKAVYGK